MALPVALDIAIGLFFIYLIASLLASELQELVSTLLQWRAKHLKESIENLLSGGQGTTETDKLLVFVETLYEDPLIKNMNQGAKGLIGEFGRWLYQNILYRKSIFGRRTTAPSYIAPETFATALLEQLGMSVIVDKLTETRLEKFATRLVGVYQTQDGRLTIPGEGYFKDRDNWEKGAIRIIATKAKSLGHAQTIETSDSSEFSLNSDENFLALVEDFDDILRDFNSQEATLSISVDRMQEGMETYIRQIDEKLSSAAPNSSTAEAQTLALSDIDRQRLNYFKKRLESLRLSTFGEKSERAILSGKLKPSLQEIAQVFDRSSSIYLEVASAYREAAFAYDVGQTPEKIQPLLQQIATKLIEISTTGREGLLIAEPITLPQNFTALLKDEQSQPYLKQVLNQLNPEEQEEFKGWQTFDQIILKVISKLAQTLQTEERLFDRNKEFVEPVSTLDTQTKLRLVDESLDKLPNEDRHLLINQALSELSPEERKTFRNYETYGELQKILQKVPNSVKQSLAILARRAQTKVQQADDQLDQFNYEVSVWFDRSMSRASGVYKRNAKGVAILIGFLIAVLSNTDTFHVVSRLADDEDLRRVVAQRAAEVNRRVPDGAALTSQDDLRQLKIETDSVLKEISVPLRWTPANLREQLSCPAATKNTDLNNWATFYKDCLPTEATTAQAFDPIILSKIVGARLIDAVRVMLGWLVSGVAIAMGAPFWFDLLSKVMNVRNTGAKPAPVAAKEPTKPTV